MPIPIFKSEAGVWPAPVTNPKCRIGSLGDHLTFVTSGGREVYWFIEFDAKAL